MKQGSVFVEDPEILKLKDPERYYDLYVAPRQPIRARCMACGYNKMFHDPEFDTVYCGRCGGAW